MFEAGEKVKWRVNDRVAFGEVDQVVESGIVPGIATTVNGPAARVKVIRDNQPTDDYVGIPLSCLDRVAARSDMRRSYQMRPPNEDELKTINKMIPTGAPPRTVDNTVIVPLLAADNLINRGLDKWDLPSLQTMSKIGTGIPALLDHDWDDVGKVWGKVFAAHYEHSDKAPADAIDMAGNRKLNRRVIDEEGYAATIFEVFSDPNNPVISAIRNGYIGKVSTGGFEFSDFYCPECGISFRDERCPHEIPDKYWGITHDKYPDQVAPYAIRVGLSDMGEVSIVTIPNLPNAGVI